MKSSIIMGCLVIVGVNLLVEQTEGHFTFFSPKEMREMMEKEKTGKKTVDQQSVSDEKQSDNLPSIVQVEQQGKSQGKPVETGDQFSPRQRDHVSQVVGEILQEMLTDAEKVFSERT